MQFFWQERGKCGRIIGVLFLKIEYMWIEKQEPLEEKRKKFDTMWWDYNSLDDSSKNALDSLKFPMKDNKNESSEQIIHWAINNTVQSGIDQANLWKEDKEKAENIKQQMMEGLNGKSPQEMIQEYAKFRTELLSVLATDSAKDQTWNDQSRKFEKEQKSKEWEKQDFADKVSKSISQYAQELWDILKKKAKLAESQMQNAKKDWNQESRWAQEQAFEALSRWPK